MRPSPHICIQTPPNPAARMPLPYPPDPAQHRRPHPIPSRRPQGLAQAVELALRGSLQSFSPLHTHHPKGVADLAAFMPDDSISWGWCTPPPPRGWEGVGVPLPLRKAPTPHPANLHTRSGIGGFHIVGRILARPSGCSTAPMARPRCPRRGSAAAMFMRRLAWRLIQRDPA
jgi:hypothetical protein